MKTLRALHKKGTFNGQKLLFGKNTKVLGSSHIGDSHSETKILLVVQLPSSARGERVKEDLIPITFLLVKVL